MKRVFMFLAKALGILALAVAMVAVLVFGSVYLNDKAEETDFVVTERSCRGAAMAGDAYVVAVTTGANRVDAKKLVDKLILDNTAPDMVELAKKVGKHGYRIADKNWAFVAENNRVTESRIYEMCMAGVK